MQKLTIYLANLFF